MSLLKMHIVSKKSGQLNVSITPEHTAFIQKLQKYRITGPELIRGLLDAAEEFHAAHGWLSFPLKVIPEKFQLTGHDTADTLSGGDTATLKGKDRPSTKPRRRAA